MTTRLRGSRVLWGVLLLIAVGIALRVLRLSWQPLWWDEGYSVYFATEPLVRMLDLTARDIHPPLYYALLHGWIGLWKSAQPLVDRSLSVLFGAAGLALQAWLAWLLFPGVRRILWVAVLLLAVNPMHFYYSQEVRMYGLGFALSAASTAFFWRWMRTLDKGLSPTGSWLPAAGYVLVSTAGLYTLYYFVFVLAGQLLWALVHFRKRLRLVWLLLAAQAVIALFYLPWLLYTVPKLVAYVGQKVVSDQDVAMDPVRYFVRHLGAFAGGHLLWAEGSTLWPALAIVALLAAGLLIAARKYTNPTQADRPALALLSTLIIVAFVGGWLVSLRYPFFPEGGERLLIFVLPFVTLVLAWAVNRTWSVYAIGRIALAGLLAVAAAGIYVFLASPRYVEHDYRPILAQIVRQGRNEDTLLAIFPWQVGYWRAYTPQDDAALAGPAPRLLSDNAVSWSPDVQQFVDDALATGTIWFPEPLTFGSTLPEEIEGYLRANASNLEDRWFDATRLTAWTRLPAPETPGTPEADFGAVQLVQAAAAPSIAEAANQPVAVGLVWQIAQPADLNISLRLLDDTGYIWSSREYEAPWASIQPGSQETQTVGLIVPVGLPPGAYAIGVSVARQDERGNPSDALTLAGSDKVDAVIGRLTVTAPDAVQAAARLPIGTPLDPPVEQEGVAFLGFTGPNESAPILTGTELGITLFLQSRMNVPAARSVYISLLDTQGQGAAGYEGWPLADYPLSLLTNGELLRLPIRISVPGALTSGDYQLVAGFVEADGGAKTPPVALGTVRLEQRRASFERATPAVELASPAQFGTHARLYGYSLEPANDGTDTIRLYWEVLQPLLPPHHIFVHADSADGATLAQHDAPPVTAAGPAPSGSWQPGEFLVTEHALDLPSGATIKVGLYDPVSLVRLPVTVDGAAAGDSVELPLTAP